MTDLLRSGAVPAYLLLCLLLGGSRQGIWANAGLQLIAILLLAWAAIARRDDPPTSASRQLLGFAVAAALLVLVQLIPLPPDVWSGLPGREPVERGFTLLGYEPAWLPLSVAPYDTLEAAYALLPPFAVIAAIVALGWYKESWIAAAVLAGALASVLLGVVQVASATTASWAYLYEFTNAGAVGFFANRNHMATLLLAAIPFAGALFAAALPQVKSRSKAFAMLSLGAGGFMLAIAGLVLNDSLAALALAVPVIGLTVLLLPIGWQIRWLILPLAAAGLIGSIIVLGSSAVGTEPVASSVPGAGYSRTAIWNPTVEAIEKTFPAGTGLGTFPHVYALGEDPAAVGATYINHAHNDYLELVLEAGLPGLVLMVLFLLWWAWRAVGVWRSPVASQFAKAATIASGAILAHSIVDYPLRTSAIAALFAACVAMMAQAQARSAAPAKQRADEPRHVRIA